MIITEGLFFSLCISEYYYPFHHIILHIFSCKLFIRQSFLRPLLYLKLDFHKEFSSELDNYCLILMDLSCQKSFKIMGSKLSGEIEVISYPSNRYTHTQHINIFQNKLRQRAKKIHQMDKNYNF